MREPDRRNSFPANFRKFFRVFECGMLYSARAHIAQLVEHVLGKNGVMGSTPIASSCLESFLERLHSLA